MGKIVPSLVLHSSRALLSKERGFRIPFSGAGELEEIFSWKTHFRAVPLKVTGSDRREQNQRKFVLIKRKASAR